MKEQLIQFWNDEEGATAIEYGLIAGLIAVVIIAAVTSLGSGLKEIFKEIGDKLNTVAGEVKTPTPAGG